MEAYRRVAAAGKNFTLTGNIVEWQKWKSTCASNVARGR
jgi:Cu2+-containing amine oxidase